MLTANDLFTADYYIANGNVLLTGSEKNQMENDWLGWDNAVRSDCPNPYVCKNGALPQPGTDTLLFWTYLGIFKCNVPVTVIVDSPTPSNQDIIDIVANAYAAAAVPNMTGAPCPQ